MDSNQEQTFCVGGLRYRNINKSKCIWKIEPQNEQSF